MWYNTIMTNLNGNLGMGMGPLARLHISWPLLLLVVLWSLFWKGLALWGIPGRRGHVWWFIILLIVNTIGILEIIYLFWVIKLKISTISEKDYYQLTIFVLYETKYHKVCVNGGRLLLSGL